MPATDTRIVTLVDGVQVVVPDSLDLITPYVLLEQQDWFEDEIKFLRRLLKPGQKVIDVGANYGVYALSMARTVGPAGRVWAFEPASSTAQLLEQGIAVNGFAQVALERCALSAAGGTADLSLNSNSEMNALVHGKPGAGTVETVAVTTLDECMERHDWRDIHFIKIDAEGEEENILRGGKRLFAEQSPLVQYEIKAGTDVHMELVDRFAALGYRSYRLVPGLDLLVPFDAGSPPDGFLLNLLCCKQDRAGRLAAEGYLLDDDGQSLSRANATASAEGLANRSAYHWRQTIARLPYGARVADLWERTTAAGKSTEVERALSLHAVSRDRSLSPGERFGALEAALNLLREVCERQASHLRLASLARIARDYGARALAVAALQHLADATLQRQHERVDPGEPFLAPGERFDAVPPRDSMGKWVLAGVLEQIETLGHFSSFYKGVSSRERLEAIRDLGFGTPEMARRLDLLRKRFGID